MAHHYYYHYYYNIMTIVERIKKKSRQTNSKKKMISDGINLRNYKTLLVLCNWSSGCYPLGALSIAYTSTGYFIKKGEVGGGGLMNAYFSPSCLSELSLLNFCLKKEKPATVIWLDNLPNLLVIQRAKKKSVVCVPGFIVGGNVSLLFKLVHHVGFA